MSTRAKTLIGDGRGHTRSGDQEAEADDDAVAIAIE